MTHERTAILADGTEIPVRDYRDEPSVAAINELKAIRELLEKILREVTRRNAT